MNVSSMGISNLFWTYLIVLFPGVWIFSYMERKISADLQARVGPRRAGAAGFFQPLADFLKMLQKEKFGALSYEERLSAAVCWLVLGGSVALLPLGSFALFIDSDLSAFLVILFFLILSLLLSIYGLSQRELPSWLGASRVASQSLTASVPVFLALLCPVMVAGSLQWSRMAAVQSFSPIYWGIFETPFQPIAFIVFLLGGLILVQSSLGAATASSAEIHEGVASQLLGFRLSLFRFGKVYTLFLWCLITVVVFLGAWDLPEALVEEWRGAGRERLLSHLELALLMVKTLSLMLICVWLGRSNARGRIEQVTRFSWRVLCPLAVFAVMGTALWLGWGLIG